VNQWNEDEEIDRKTVGCGGRMWLHEYRIMGYSLRIGTTSRSCTALIQNPECQEFWQQSLNSVSNHNFSAEHWLPCIFMSLLWTILQNT